MDWIRDYLLRIICAAILCGIVVGFLGKKGAIGATVKLMAGIFMVLTMVSPWTDLRIGEVWDYIGAFSADADGIIGEAELDAKEALSAIIKSKTEAYILDKADSFGAELTVEVSLDGSDLPAPCAVRIDGSISPYGRKLLERVITDEIGIALEDQTWIG